MTDEPMSYAELYTLLQRAQERELAARQKAEYDATARIAALESEVKALRNQVEALKYGEVVARQLAAMIAALSARVEALKAELADQDAAMDHEMEYSHSLAQTVEKLMARMEALEHEHTTPVSDVEKYYQDDETDAG